MDYTLKLPSQKLSLVLFDLNIRKYSVTDFEVCLMKAEACVIASGSLPSHSSNLISDSDPAPANPWT
jgi:hypothetical protein